MSIRVEYNVKGDTEDYLKNLTKVKLTDKLRPYGEKGVRLLAEATPIDTGKTAESWSYRISGSDDAVTISWHNSNRSSSGKNRIPVVQLIRYGHVTKNGGYVSPNDFVSPIAERLFNEIDTTVAGIWYKGSVKGLKS